MALTEKTWESSMDLQAMLDHLKQLKPRPDERKTRLFLCACVRCYEDHFFPPLRRAIDAAETFADDAVEPLKKKMLEAGNTLYHSHQSEEGLSQKERDRRSMARFAGRAAAYGRAWDGVRFLLEFGPILRQDMKPWCGLARCVFGNPFREVTVDPAWLAWNGGSIPAIAQAIYAERAFDRLPILADALEDAGCTDPAILDHLRSSGPHTRGCWALDLWLERGSGQKRGWTRLKEMARLARLRIFLPHPVWLVHFSPDCKPDAHPLDDETRARFNLNVFLTLVPEMVLDRELDTKKLSRDRRVSSVSEAWVVTSEDPAGFPAEPQGRLIDSPFGQALLYTDYEKALRDLAVHSAPVRLLVQLRDHGPVGARKSAQEALEGRPQALPRLADALDTEGHALAQLVRLLEGASQALQASEGIRKEEADLELEHARLFAATEACPGCGQLGKRDAGRVEQDCPEKGRLFLRCPCGRLEWFAADTGPQAIADPAAVPIPPPPKVAPARKAKGDEGDDELDALQAAATPCPECGKPRRAFRVKKEGPNKGRPFYRCSDWNCQGFEWVASGTAATAPKSEKPAAKRAAATPQAAGEEATLLQAIHAAPEEDGPRLAYADWLESSGQGPRAELIRVQIELARRPENSSLRSRERELLGRHGRDWFGPLRLFLRDADFARGLLVPRTVDAAALVRHADALFRETPVRSLSVRVDGAAQVKALVQSGVLARLQSLRLTGDVGISGAKTLAGAKDLINLTSLSLVRGGIARQGLEVLMACPYLARLESLDLSHNHAGKEAFRLLGTSPYLANLTHLGLGHCNISGVEITSIAESSYVKRLVSLNLLHSGVTREGLAVLGRSANGATLEALQIEGYHHGADSARRLAASQDFPRLTSLDWPDSQLHDSGIRALARWPRLAQLTHLNLGDNSVSDQGALLLSRSPHLAALNSLNLHSNPLGDDGAAALADCAGLASLTSLNLSHCLVEQDGLTALLRSRHLSRLAALDLSGNPLRDRGGQALARSPLAARLVSLGLARTRMGVEGIRALARVDGAMWELLDVSDNPLGDEGAMALAGSPALTHLTALELSRTALTARGLAALLESPHLDRLENLGLAGIPLGEEGARVLAGSPRLAGLRRLNLTATRLTEQGWQAILDSPHLWRPGVVVLQQDDIENLETVARAVRGDRHFEIQARD